MQQHLITCILLCVSHAAVAEQPVTSGLEMIITGFSSNDGQVTVALSDSRENYEARKGGQEPLRGCAVKLFHDENSNGDLDTNFPGIPNEPYASSNNALGSFGPPDYEVSLFSFNPEQLSIYILVE